MTRVPFLQQRRGFSLAELIIYLGILGISAGIFGGMLNTISTTQIAEFNQNEVSGQLNFAIQTIQRYVRAASIIEGESGTPSSTLVLQMPVAAQNPTSISLQNNRIYITQGATGTPLAITNDKVSIDNLEFRRFAQPASKDVVQIDIAISQESAGGKRIARSLRSAITRVNAAAFDSDLIPNSDGSYNVGTYPSARWRDGSFSGQVSAGSFCFASDCRTSWANIAGVSGSGSANYVAKWNTASTINASTLIYDNGTNVGIGAINPGYKLDVQGGQINTSGGLCINGDCKTAWSQIAGTQAWTATGTSIYYNTGNVGIGMVNPGSKLDVLGDIRSGTSYRTSIQGDGSGARVLFGSEGDPDYLGIIGAFASMMQIDSYNGPLVFKEAGSEKVRITSGNVGIGTTAPGAKLHVSGGSILMDNNLAFKFKDSTGTAQNVFFAGTDNVLYIQPLNVTKGTSIQYGNLGVGTNVPTAKLQVNPGTAVEGIRIISSDYSPFIIRNSADTADLFRVDQNGNITGGTGNASAWTRNSTSGYLYTSALTDRVGIGTATPGIYNGVVSGLEVKGSSHTGIAINSPTDYAASLTLAENNNPMWHILSRGDSANRFEIYAADGTSSGAKITVLQGGNVGIGTVSPAAALHVYGTGNTYSVIDSPTANVAVLSLRSAGVEKGGIYRPSGSSDIRLYTGGDVMTLTASGYVGIGTTAPAQKLSVAGTIESTSGGVKFPDGTTQTTAYAGGTQTIVSGNVSSGAFGSNTGGGNYSFPGSVGIGTVAPTAGYELDVVGNIMGSSYANIGGYVIGNGNYAMYRSNVSRGSITFDTLTAGGSYPIKLASGDGVTYTGGYLTYATDGAERMRIDASGNVGIGTTNPIYGKLQITDSGTYADGLTLYAGSGNLAASYLKSDGASDFNWHLTRGGSDTIGMIIKANGNVGIGTTSPAQKLSVAGTIESTSGGVKFPDGTTQTTAYAGGTQTVVAGNVSSGAFGANTGGGNYSFPANVGIGTTAPTTGKLQIDGYNYNNNLITLQTSNWTSRTWGIGMETPGMFAIRDNTAALDRIVIDTSGNVGIGTTAPTESLQVAGNIKISNDKAYTFKGSDGYDIQMPLLNSSNNVLFGRRPNSNGTGVNDYIFRTGADVDRLTIQGSTGNVGIGTTSPGTKLDVVGGSGSGVAIRGTNPGLIFYDASNNIKTQLYSESSTGSFGILPGGTVAKGLWQLSSGNVGIGTTSPTARLQITDSGPGIINGLTLENYVNDEGDGQAISFADAGANHQIGARIRSYAYDAGAFGLAFDVGGSLIEAMRMTHDGKVGIGKTNPATALDVNGTVTASAFSGALSGTVTAPNVSSGAFGANTGGGNYSFPGNVGIGTTAPGAKLEVLGASETTGTIRINGGKVNVLAVGEINSALEFNQRDASVVGGVAGKIASISEFSNGAFAGLGFYTARQGRVPELQEAMRIDNTGNVGIGTTAPGAKLDVNSSILISGSSPILYMGSYRAIESSATNLIFGGTSAAAGFSNLTFTTYNGNSIERMRIDNNGNVGIGTTSPATKLDIASGHIKLTNGWSIQSSNSANSARMLLKAGTDDYTTFGSTDLGFKFLDNSLSGNLMTILNTGNVGIGTTGPTHKLDVSGSFYSRLVTKGNCTGAVTIDWNAGNTQHCVLTGNVTFTFSNGQSGGNYKLVLKQGGTGSYTITWPGTVRWGGAVSPTLTTTVGKSDYVGFFYNGVDSTYDGNAFNANF